MKSLQSYEIENKALFSSVGECDLRAIDLLGLLSGCLADTFLLQCLVEGMEDIAEEQDDLFTELGNIFKP